MKRAIDIGPVDAAAIKTTGGKIRLRLLFTTEQLEALLSAAREDDDEAVKRDVTQCNAPEKSESRREVDDEDDARATSPPKVIERSKYVFVIEGTRAWQAWLDHRERTGQIKSMPTTMAQVDGAHRRGWYLPTLFPPQSTGPPSESITTADSN